MDALFVLQFACCIVTTMLMTILACSGFIARWRRSRYELSRWLLCGAMFLLTTHFILQMKHGLRASGDDVGGNVQHPVLFACGIFHIFFNVQY